MKTHVSVVSSGFECGNTATIHVDGSPVLPVPRRGFNVLVLLPVNDAWQSQVPTSFDTHGNHSADDEFHDWLNQVSQNDGALVVLSVCDDAANKLSEKTRSAIASVLGSTLINKLTYRCSFALVARIGDGVASEAVSGNAKTSTRVDAYVDASTRGGLFVSATSAGFDTVAESFVLVGARRIPVTRRGLNAIEIDETTGVVIKHQVFDTFASTAASEAFAEYIASLPNDRVVVVLVRGEASRMLTAHAVAASVSLGADHLDELAFRDSYVLIGCKGWAPCFAYEPVPGSGIISVSCSLNIRQLDSIDGTLSETEVTADGSLASPESQMFLAMPSPVLCKAMPSITNEYSDNVADDREVVDEIPLSFLQIESSRSQPQLSTELDDQHNIYVEILSELIENSPQFKSVTLALQRARDFPTDQEAFQAGQNALKTVWRQSLLNANFGGVNEENTTMLKKIFKFEQGVLAVDTITDQPIFAEGSSDLILDVIDTVLAAAAAAEKAVPETETLRIMRSAFGQSDAKKLLSELVAVSTLDDKLRIALAGKINSCKEILSKAMHGSQKAHAEVADELQRNLSVANASVESNKKERIEIVNNIDRINQAFGDIFSQNSELNLDSLVNAIDPDAGLAVAFAAIEEHFKRLSEVQKGKIGEIEILDELKKQLQTFTGFVNAKQREIEHGQKRIESLKNTIAVCETSITSFTNDKATATTKRDAANNDVQKQKSRQDGLKQAGRDIDGVANTKAIGDDVFNRLSSSVAGVGTKINQLRTACTDHRNGQLNLETILNREKDLQRNRQTLSQSVQNALRDQQNAASFENAKYREYNNESDRVKDGKSTKANPNKRVKYNQYQDAVRSRQYRDSLLSDARSRVDQNERALVQASTDRTAAQQRLDSFASSIAGVCREMQAMINSQNVEAINAELAAKTNVLSYQKQIDDATSSIATNIAKKDDARGSLPSALTEVQNATALLTEYQKRTKDIEQQISSGEINYEKPHTEVSPPNDEEVKNKAKMLITEREAASKKLHSIDEKMYLQQQYISKLMADLEAERSIIADLDRDSTAVSAAILEAQQKCKRDIERYVADFSEQLNANISVAGVSTFATWSDNRNNDSRAQSLLRCLIGRVRGLTLPYTLGDDHDVVCAAKDFSDVQKSSVETLVKKLLKNYPSEEISGSAAVDLATALINEEFSTDAAYQQISGLEIRSTVNQLDVASVFTQSLLKRPSNNILLYDASNASHSEFIELRLLSTSNANDAVQFLKTLARYASSAWAVNPLVVFLANLLLRKPIGEATIEELGESIRAVQAMHGDVEHTANRLQEAIAPVVADNTNSIYKLDPVTQLGLRIMDRLFGARTAITQAACSHVDSTSDELIRLSTGIEYALQSFIERLSRTALNFLHDEIQRRRNAVLSGSESSLSGETADRLSELNSDIEQQTAALESKQAELRKFDSLMDNKEKQTARVAMIGNELKRIDERIGQLSDENTKKLTELAKLRESTLDAHVKTEQLLKDIQARREEIAKLTSERASVERKLSLARDAADEATRVYNAAKAEEQTLQAKLETTQRLLEDSKKELEDMTRWSKFVKAVRDAINTDFNVIRLRVKLSQEYREIRRANLMDVFPWLSKSLPDPDQSSEANYWHSRKNALWANDMCSKVLDDKLYINPLLSLQIGVSFTIAGPSLNYSEVKQLLRGWAVARLEPLGLALDKDDMVYVKVPAVVPGFKAVAMPEPLQIFFERRIALFYQHRQKKKQSNRQQWDEQIGADGLETARYYTEMMNAGYGANLMDIVHAFAPTVETLTGFNFLIESDVKLPAINFYVTCASNVKLDSNVLIDTSAADQPTLRFKKARNGSEYRANAGEPKGRDGDDGLDGVAGFNGGHVTIRAYGSIIGSGAIKIKTDGEKGHDGQIGGDGDAGQKGYNVPNADAPDTSSWGRNMTVGIARYPGQDKQRKFPPEGGYPNELSGQGGDGGTSGVGGEGGEAGEVNLVDPEQTITVKCGQGVSECHLKDNSLIYISSLTKEHGNDPIGARGGPGGQPGKRGLDEVGSKSSFWVKTKWTVCTIDVDSKEFENAFSNSDWVNFIFDPVVFRRHAGKEQFNQSFGWTRKWKGVAMPIVPKITGDDQERNRVHSRSIGKAGTASLSASQQNSTHQRQQRQTHQNVSTISSYQKKMYAAAQTMQVSEKYLALETEYSQRQQQLSQNVQELQKSQDQTTSKQQEAVKKVEQASEHCKQMEKQLNSLIQQRRDVESLYRAQADKLNAAEIQSLALLANSLALTKEAAQLQKAIQGNQIDSEMSQKQTATIREVAAAVEAQLAAKQAQWLSQKQQIQREIAALTREIAANRLKQNQVVQVEQLASLDGLLSQLSNVNSKQQQQQQQQSMQSEADLESGSSFVDDDTQIIVRSYFRRDDKGVWSLLTPLQANRLDKILSSFNTEISDNNDERVIALESLELLLRYGLYTDKLDDVLQECEKGPRPQEDQPPAKSSESNLSLGPRLQAVLQGYSQDIRLNHWFCVSLSGVSIGQSPDSIDFLTICDASLRARYDNVASVSVSMKPTAYEQYARQVLGDLRRNGPDVAALAALLKRYSSELMNAQLAKGSGLMALYEGRPVIFLDKISRTLLLYARKNDDTLVKSKLEIILGAAHTISDVANSLGIPMLVNVVKRKRDLRGDRKPPTTQLLSNLELAQQHFDKGQLDEAMAVLRTEITPVTETIQSAQSASQLVDLIKSLSTVVSNKSAVTEKISTIARVIGAGIVLRSDTDIKLVLDALGETGDRNPDLNLASCVSSAAVAYIYAISPSSDFLSRLQESLNVRLSTPQLRIAERVQRITAFCNIAKLKFNDGEKTELDRTAATETLVRSSTAYALNSEDNAKAIHLFSKRESSNYSELVESVSYDIVACDPELQPESQSNLSAINFNAHTLLPGIIAARNQAPILKDLAALAIRTAKSTIVAEVLEQLRTDKEVKLDSALIGQKLLEFNISERTDTLDVFSDVLKQLQHQDVRSRWMSAVSDSTTNADDLHCLLVALIRNSDISATVDALVCVYSTATAEQILKWTDLLELSLALSVNTLIDQTVAFFDNSNAQETTIVGYLAQVVTSALRNPAIDSETPSATRIGALIGILSVFDISLTLNKAVSKLNIKQPTGNELNDKIAELLIGSMYQLVAIAHDFGADPAQLGRGPRVIAAGNDVKTETDRLRDKIAKLLLDVGQMLPKDNNATQLAKYRLDVLYSCFHVCCGSDTSYLIASPDAIKVARSYLTANNLPQNITDASSDILVRTIRAVEEHLDSVAVNDSSKGQKTIDSVTDTVRSTLLTTTVNNASLQKIVQTENDRRVQMWRTMLLQFEDLNSIKSSIDRTTLFDKVISDIKSATHADIVDGILAGAVNAELVNLRSRNEFELPDLFSQVDSWGNHAEKIQTIRKAIHLAPGMDFIAYAAAACEAAQVHIVNILQSSDANAFKVGLAWVLNHFCQMLHLGYFPHDNKHEDLLPNTIRAISQLSLNANMDEFMADACRNLSNVLSLCDFQRGSYSQVDLIKQATFENSNCAARLKLISDAASTVVEKLEQAITADVLLADDKHRAYNLVEEIRKSQSFTESSVTNVIATVDQSVDVSLVSSIPTSMSYEEAVKAVLALPKVSNVDLSTLATITNALCGKPASVQLNSAAEVVSRIFVQRIKSIVGFAHFSMGRAIDSGYNEDLRSTDDEQARVLREYTVASDYGCLNADSNMAFIDFVAKQTASSFEKARQDILPVLEDLASKGDENAKNNVELLQCGQPLRSGYEFFPPQSASTVNRAKTLATFRGVVTQFVEDIMRIIDGIGPLTPVDGIGILAAIFGSPKCQEYTNALKDMTLSLEQQSKAFIEFTECIASGITKAPPFAKRGIIAMAQDISLLKLDSEAFVPCGALFMSMRPRLIPNDLKLGSIMKYVVNSSSASAASSSVSVDLRLSYLLFAATLLRRDINEKLNKMQADIDNRTTAAIASTASQEAEQTNFSLLRRTEELFFIKLKVFAETLTDEQTRNAQIPVSSSAQLAVDHVKKLIPLMCDFSMIHLGVEGSLLSWLTDNGISVQDLMTSDEIAIARAIGDNLTAAACYEGSSSNKRLRNPTTWESSLRRSWFTFTLNGFLRQSIEQSLQSVKNPVAAYDKNLRIKRLDDELTKIQNAYSSLNVPDRVDSFEQIENCYQNIFNFSHYILYLTTTEYVISEMVPFPGPNASKEDFAAYEKRCTDLTPVARDLVKSIKVACDAMIDLFGIAKSVHENLIAAVSVWADANLFSGLISIVSYVTAQPKDKPLEPLQYFMWLISKDKPDSILSTMRYKASTGSTFFTTITQRIADCLISFTESVQQPEISEENSKGDFKKRLSNIVSRLQTGALPDDVRGWRYAKMVFTAITQTAARPGKDVVIITLLTFKQISSIIVALELSMKSEAWSSMKLVNRLQSLANLDSWIPLLEAHCIKLSLGYDEVKTSDEDEKEFDRTVAGIVRLTGRRGQLVGSSFQSCLCELLRLAKPNHLAHIAERVASNRYKFSTSDNNTYKAAGKLESSDKMMNCLSEFYDKIQSNKIRSATRIVGIMQEESNTGGMNEGVSTYLCKDGPSSTDATLMERRLLAIDAIYKAKFENFNKQNIIDWSRKFRSERAEGIFRDKDIDGINEMLAIFQRVVQCADGFFMRIPQLMSVILFVDAMCHGKSRLGEIGTGEGKSLIVTFCAATRVFMGQRVDVLSSNKVLAERDTTEALKWLQYLDISVSNNCDEKAENDEDERAHRYDTHDVIYGEAGYFQRDVLLSRHFGKKIRTQLAPCVIVDEVDSMFIDTVGNTLYISHCIEDLKLLSDVFVQIWMAVHGADAIEATEANVAKVSEFISSQITSGTLLVPNQLHDFTTNRIRIWVRSAYQAKTMFVDDQYTTVSSGKRRGEVVVMDLYSGVEQMTTRWSNGLHQFIQLKHNNKLSPESLKAIFMANLQYFKEYGNNIIGMTGTIGGQPERQMLARTYGCDFYRMPRFAEENFYEDPPVLAGNRARWLELISEEAVNQAIYGRNYGFDISKDARPSFNIEAAKKDLESDQKKLDTVQNNLTRATSVLNATKQRLSIDKALQSRINTIQKDLQPTSVLSYRDMDVLSKILNELSSNTTISPLNNAGDFSVNQALCATWLQKSKDALGNLKMNEDQYAKLSMDFEKAKTSIAETDLKIKKAASPTELPGLKNLIQEQQALALDITSRLRSCKDQSTLLQKATLDATKTLLCTCSELLKLSTDADTINVQSLASKELSTRDSVTDLKLKVQAYKDAIEFGGGRAVLIICRNKLDAKDVANTLMNDQRLKRIYVFLGTIEGVTEMDCSTRTILRTQISMKDLSPRDIIVSTNIAGRGLSLGLTKPVKECGGLHVVISFVPENVRVEAQAWGRAARQGAPGSGRFVVCESNLTALSEDVSLSYLLMERDTNEQKRLDVIMTETVPRIDMEKSLFDKFAQLSAELDAIKQFKDRQEEQRISLRDRWAFFLEEQGQNLDDIFKDPDTIAERINRAFQEFRSSVLSDVRTSTYGLIKDPGNLLRIVHSALKKEEYHKAIEASDAIIRADPRFGAYGYYYKALALFGSGTHDMNRKAKAMSLLNNAVLLFNRSIDSLQSQSQVVKALNDNENRKGKGTGPDYFTQCNTNTASMIQVHVNAAQEAIGYALSESNFDTSAISGDLAKDVYGIVTSEPALQNVLLPFRLSGDLEIRVLLDIQDRNTTSKWLNRRKKDADYSISGSTAYLKGCTTVELDEFEKDNVAFELKLVRRGNQSSDTSVAFPEQFSYATQEIIRNIHAAASHKTLSKLNFDQIQDRSKLNEWLFAPLIKEEEAKAYFSSLADGGEQEYLVVNEDWRSAAMGRWDETGFNGIGKQLRDWFVQLVDNQSARHVSTKIAVDKAAEFLTGQAKNPNLSLEAVDAMVSRGVVTKKKLIAVKSDKGEIISSYDEVIEVPENVNEASLQKLDLSGYSLLHNNRAAVLDLIRTQRGKTMKTDHLYTALKCSMEEVSDAFVVLKALMRIAGLDTFLCERLKLNVPKKHREPLDTALERIKYAIEPNAWESVGKPEDLRSALVSQHVILQPQIGPHSFDESGYSTFLSSGSPVSRVKDAVGKHCENKIRDFVRKIKKPDQDENDTVDQFISDIKDALEQSVGQLVKDASETLKVSLQTLEDNVDKKDLPPELIDFFQSCCEIVFKVEIKKSWWDWNAFAVAMIGLVQVVAGAALLVLTAGTATTFANALIGEGIGDMIYATQAGLTGTFSWKEWGEQKAISLAISIATAGVGAYLSRGAQVAKIGVKVTASAIAKAVAKKILGQILEAAVSQLVAMGAEKLAEIATKALFDAFRKDFSSWVQDNAMAQNSINQCKKELKKLVQKCGEEQATKYFVEAVQKAMTNSTLQDGITGKIESHVMNVAEKLGDNLKIAGNRLKYSSSSKAKLLGNIATVIGVSVKTGKVLFALQDIVAVVPLAFNDISRRLQNVRLSDAQSQQSLMTDDEAAAIAERLIKDKATSQILAQIQAITEAQLMGFAFNEALSYGVKPLTDRIGKLGDDYEALHDRALALGELRSMRRQNALEAGKDYQEKAKHLESEMKKSSKYESPLEDLKDKPNTVVRYMGKRVKVSEIRDWVGDSGLKALPAADGSLYLMRTDIDNYVKSLTVNKRSNLADLHIYAAAAGVDIKLLHQDSFDRAVTKLIRGVTADPDSGGTRPLVTLKLVFDSKHPDGHYVMMKKNATTSSMEPVEGLASIGNSCAPQQLVYFKALQSGETDTRARELANKKENIDEFLSKASKMAKTDERVASAYYNRKQDIWPDVIGGAYRDTPEKESEGLFRRQMALENQVTKFMILKEKREFETAYAKYFGEGKEFAARDVTRYLSVHTNPDGSEIHKALDWVKNMVDKDPQFLSRSPFDQLKALRREGYTVDQAGPWPLLEKPNVLKAGQTWMTNKSDHWSVDFDDWGFPILDKYAVAVVNLTADQTMGLDRPAHLKNSTQLIAGDKAAVSLALSRLSSDEQSLFMADLNEGAQKLTGYTWHHAGHEFGRMLLVPTEVHDAFKHTGWDSVLRTANITDDTVFKNQRALGKAMDAYSGYGMEENEVGKAYRSATSSVTTDAAPLKRRASSSSYTTMTDTWLTETRSQKRARRL